MRTLHRESRLGFTSANVKFDGAAWPREATDESLVAIRWCVKVSALRGGIRRRDKKWLSRVLLTYDIRYIYKNEEVLELSRNSAVVARSFM